MQRRKVISVEFDEGDEVVSELKNAFSQNKIQRATISSVEGKIADFDLNVFSAGVFRKKHFDGVFKITSMQGVFIEKGNMGYKGDLYVSLVSEDGNSVGGALLRGRAAESLVVKAEINEFK
jgi:predicted DNA-binding protein with PD1-like motif